MRRVSGSTSTSATRARRAKALRSTSTGISTSTETGTYKVQEFAEAQRTPTVTRSPRAVALCSNVCSGWSHSATRKRGSSFAALTNCFTWLAGERERTNVSAAVCTSSIDCVVANAGVANDAQSADTTTSRSCEPNLFTTAQERTPSL